MCACVQAYWLKVPFGAVTARRDKVMLVQGYLKGTGLPPLGSLHASLVLSPALEVHALARPSACHLCSAAGLGQRRPIAPRVRFPLPAPFSTLVLYPGILLFLCDTPALSRFMRNLLQTRYQPFYGLPKNSTGMCPPHVVVRVSVYASAFVFALFMLPSAAYPSCSLGNSFKCFTGAGDEKRRADLVAAHGEQIALTAAVFVLTLQGEGHTRDEEPAFLAPVVFATRVFD